MLISAAMLKVMSRSLHYQPSGHRTESHIPHLSLSLSLPPLAFLCVVSHKRSSPLLFLHVSSARSSISLVFAFSFIFHLSVTAALDRFFPFAPPFSLFSPPPSLLSGCVYLALLFLRGFMPFTWEPLCAPLRALSSRCAYLAVM